jgi:hypothetical protein
MLLAALAFAASASVASGFQIHLPPQQKKLLDACETAADHVRSAVKEASRTQAQTIETQLVVLKRGRLDGDIAFARIGANISIASDAGLADAAKYNCGHGESAGKLGVGPGPAHSHIVSMLHQSFAKPGTYTVVFTLNRAGRNILARLAAADRAFRTHHPHGGQAPSIAWAVGLHYSPVR